MTTIPAKKLWINGISGRLGKNILDLCQENPWRERFSVIGGTTSQAIFLHEGNKSESPINADLLSDNLIKAELIIDVSLPKGNTLLLTNLKATGIGKKAILIATTGMDESSLSAWQELASSRQHRILIAANTSLGISLMLSLGIPFAGRLIQQGFDYELVETHHIHKKDAPSGTAKIIQERLISYGKSTNISIPEKPIHSLRGGGIFGEHTLRLMGEEEEVIITHRAYSRKLFARGALALSSWLEDQNPGFYHLEDVDLSGDNKC